MNQHHQDNTHDVNNVKPDHVRHVLPSLHHVFDVYNVDIFLEFFATRNTYNAPSRPLFEAEDPRRVPVFSFALSLRGGG